MNSFRKFLSLFSLVCLCAASARSADITAEYESLGDSQELYQQVASRLNEYKVIIAPGFLTGGALNELSNLISGTKSAYFQEQIAWLDQNNIEYQYANVNTQASVAANGKVIAGLINQSGKPVILLAHSKGGLDSLSALLTDSKVRAKTAGFITFQSPFLGTPVADYVLADENIGPTSAAMLTALGGSKQSLQDLSQINRSVYIAKNSVAISKLEAKLPVICVGTEQTAVGGLNNRYAVFSAAMLLNNQPNDGLVPTENAFLPGADTLKLVGYNHGVLVAPSRKVAFDRVMFTVKTFKLLLDRIR